jgi:hypothetical protein
VDIPAKWGIKLPMDSIVEVAAFNEKLKSRTTDEDGTDCKREMVNELTSFNMYF